jgi:Tfp pilus assembly major pilin PilA
MRIEVIVAIAVAVTVGLIAGKLYRKWRDEHAGR